MSVVFEMGPQQSHTYVQIGVSVFIVWGHLVFGIAWACLKHVWDPREMVFGVNRFAVRAWGPVHTLNGFYARIQGYRSRDPEP